MAGGSAPRYAPSDPSLPPQWKALVDGNTGYIYYWNTETNVTQYEKPLLSAVGSVIPPGPPPDPPISAEPPKLAPLPTAVTATASIASPFRSSESKRSSSSGKNGTTSTSTATLPSRSNNPPEEGLMRSPRHASASEKRSYLDNNDRRNSQSERRYQENDRSRYPPSAATSDPERRHPSSSFSLPERRHPSGSTQPDHYRDDISGHHRSGHAHMPETRARPSEAYGRSLPDHHGRHMQDHHRAPAGGSNLPRSRHVMSDSVPRASPHSIPRESMHENSIENSWGGSGHSRHAHERPVGPGRSTSSSRNDRDGRGNVGSLNKLPPLRPALQGQQIECRHRNCLKFETYGIPLSSSQLRTWTLNLELVASKSCIILSKIKIMLWQ